MAQIKLGTFYAWNASRKIENREFRAYISHQFNERFSNTGRSARQDDGAEFRESFA